ncbi:MAG: HAMP domain-containing protein [Alcanivorax sp.]|nr:HAMP domain-containing protein [Alcanivorax sp.]
MHSIQTRLFVVLSATGIALVLVAASLYQLSLERSMQGYLTDRQEHRVREVSERLAEYRASAGQWPAHEQDWHRRGPGSPPRVPRYLLVIDEQRQPLYGDMDLNPDEITLLPIQQGNRTLGWIGYPPRAADMQDAIDRRFRAQQLRTLALTTGIALLVALLGSWLLARYLVRPITAIAGMSRQLASGDYHHRLPEDRRDELGALSRDINHLAASLSKAALARDRWLADISHELRTPLAILQGEIEALVDGIRPADPKRLGSLHHEILHLRRLIDDLHDLALADAGTLRYQMAPLDFSALIDEQAGLFEDSFRQRQITLSQDVPPGLMLQGDATRLRQLLANLLANSAKYTDEGGRAVLRGRLGSSGKSGSTDAAHAHGCVILTLEDSAPGVPEDALPKLFDHLYRAESASRNRALGGSGLGLSLARRIVEAHGGTIDAQASDLGGLRIVVRLPACPGS